MEIFHYFVGFLGLCAASDVLERALPISNPGSQNNARQILEQRYLPYQDESQHLDKNPDLNVEVEGRSIGSPPSSPRFDKRYVRLPRRRSWPRRPYPRFRRSWGKRSDKTQNFIEERQLLEQRHSPYQEASQDIEKIPGLDGGVREVTERSYRPSHPSYPSGRRYGSGRWSSGRRSSWGKRSEKKQHYIEGKLLEQRRSPYEEASHGLRNDLGVDEGVRQITGRSFFPSYRPSHRYGGGPWSSRRGSSWGKRSEKTQRYIEAKQRHDLGKDRGLEGGVRQVVVRSWSSYPSNPSGSRYGSGRSSGRRGSSWGKRSEKTQHYIEDDICEQSGEIMLAHPTNCKLYIACQEGVAYVEKCQNGMSWNDDENRCDSDDIECNSTSQK